MAIYLSYEGIFGNASAEEYKGHISLFSTHFNIQRSISMEVGSMCNRENSCPKFSEVTIMKEADSSLPLFFKESVVGSKGKTAVLKYVRTGKTKLQEYMTYTLSDVMVSNYIISATKDNQPLEIITLSYSKSIISHQSFDANNAPACLARNGYDLASATSL